MTRIDIVVFDGVDELDAVGPLEVLRSAARAGADLDARLVCLREPLDVRGAHGLRLQADSVYTPGADVLVVPGGGWLARSEAGAWGEAERGEWLPLLRAAADAGVVMAGVCTGVMLLARAGVVGERPATTHRGAWADLGEAGARVLDERVVDDGNLVTAGGVTSGIDLALGLVERFAGREFAEREATRLEYPWHGAASPHPVPDGHRISTQRVHGMVSARWQGEVVAESRNALLLRESTLPPVVYLPMEDVRMDLLHRTEHRTRCPFKGEASYWSIRVGDRSSDDIAWAYEDPLPGRADLRGRIAFYADRLDALEIVQSGPPACKLCDF
jgi:uncharacterized protein (DUF427 family)/putative intracellular protease/amidase